MEQRIQTRASKFANKLQAVPVHSCLVLNDLASKTGFSWNYKEELQTEELVVVIILDASKNVNVSAASYYFHSPHVPLRRLENLNSFTKNYGVLFLLEPLPRRYTYWLMFCSIRSGCASMYPGVSHLKFLRARATTSLTPIFHHSEDLS